MRIAAQAFLNRYNLDRQITRPSQPLIWLMKPVVAIRMGEMDSKPRIWSFWRAAANHKVEIEREALKKKKTKLLSWRLAELDSEIEVLQKQ